MLKDYATRVEVVGRLLRHSLAGCRARRTRCGRRWPRPTPGTAGPEFRATPLALDFALTDSVRTSSISPGGRRRQRTGVRRDGRQVVPLRRRAAVLLMALRRDQLAPSVRAHLPEAYLLPPAWGEGDRAPRGAWCGFVPLVGTRHASGPPWRLLDP
ncbi:MAG: hypothetical protein IPG61_20250, partial [bacterium]|nr:hypothetical protein [bacterium]